MLERHLHLVESCIHRRFHVTCFDWFLTFKALGWVFPVIILVNMVVDAKLAIPSTSTFRTFSNLVAYFLANKAREILSCLCICSRARSKEFLDVCLRSCQFLGYELLEIFMLIIYLFNWVVFLEHF